MQEALVLSMAQAGRFRAAPILDKALTYEWNPPYDWHEPDTRHHHELVGATTGLRKLLQSMLQVRVSLKADWEQARAGALDRCARMVVSGRGWGAPSRDHPAPGARGVRVRIGDLGAIGRSECGAAGSRRR